MQCVMLDSRALFDILIYFVLKIVTATTGRYLCQPPSWLWADTDLNHLADLKKKKNLRAFLGNYKVGIGFES